MLPLEKNKHSSQFVDYSLKTNKKQLTPSINNVLDTLSKSTSLWAQRS